MSCLSSRNLEEQLVLCVCQHQAVFHKPNWNDNIDTLPRTILDIFRMSLEPFLKLFCKGAKLFCRRRQCQNLICFFSGTIKKTRPSSLKDDFALD